MSAIEWTVRLRLVSERLSLAEMTEMVGVDPDRCSERGSLRSGSSLPRRFSSWEVESRLSATADVDEQVADLAERMVTHAESLRIAGVQADGFELAVVGRFDPAVDHSPGVNLSTANLSFLTNIGATFDLEIIAGDTHSERRPEAAS
jgi:Domain of unknown function (DUF4279)